MNQGSQIKISAGTTASGGWPQGCRHIVATLSAAAPEAKRLTQAPHWRRGADFTPGELSSRLGKIMRQAGEAGVLGRAFSASQRRDPDDPFSQALRFTPKETESGMARVIRLSVDDPGAAAIIATLLTEHGVAQSVHPVFPHVLSDVREDRYFDLPAATPGSWAPRLIHASAALSLEPGSRDVLVAVLDTGVDAGHDELRGVVTPGYDFVHMPGQDPQLIGDVHERDDEPADEAGHGTHVAGVIAARGLKMPRGMGGKCRILPVRVLGTMREGRRRVGVGVIPDIDDGIKYAVDRGADVINLSLGIHAPGSGIPHRRAIEYARSHNVVVIAASGNDGSSVPVFPGAVPGVITVGAVTELQRVAAFSSWGPFVDVVAPGTAVFSADLDGGYRHRNGTSHAAPFVSGVAALIIARARRQGLGLRENTIRRIIRDTADSAGRRKADAYAGAGILNAYDAVLLTSHLIRSHLRRKRAGQWGRASPAAY